MRSSVIKVCVIIAYFDLLLINRVHSNWIYDNGKDVFIPIGMDSKLPRVDYVIRNPEQDNGELLYDPPKSKSESTMNNEAVQKRNGNDEEQMFIPQDTDLRPANPNHVNMEPLAGGIIVFDPRKGVSNPRVTKRRALKNGDRRKTTHSYPRTPDMNLPLYYYC